MRVRVEGTPFERDLTTKALLTVNRSAIAENEARRKLAGRINGRDAEINRLTETVESLESDMKEIKDMLRILTNRV